MYLDNEISRIINDLCITDDRDCNNCVPGRKCDNLKANKDLFNTLKTFALSVQVEERNKLVNMLKTQMNAQPYTLSKRVNTAITGIYKSLIRRLEIGL